MGIDAQIYFDTVEPLDKATLANWCFRLHSCFPDSVFTWKQDGKLEHCIRESESDKGMYTVMCKDRYYDPHYARGRWYVLYGIMRWLLEQQCVARILYASDSGREDRVDDLFLDRMWEYYATLGHSQYFDYSADHPCPDCNGPMWCSGGGGDIGDMYSCSGCGYSDWDKVRAK